jgi:hypothetical protein
MRHLRVGRWYDAQARLPSQAQTLLAGRAIRLEPYVGDVPPGQEAHIGHPESVWPHPQNRCLHVATCRLGRSGEQEQREEAGQNRRKRSELRRVSRQDTAKPEQRQTANASPPIVEASS